MAVQLIAGELQVNPDFSLTTQEAIAYLNTKYPELHLTLDAFRHRVTRGNGIPHETRKDEGVVRWFFKISDLDRVRFRSLWRKKYPTISPVAIHTSEEFDRLREKYGPLVDDAGMIEVLQRRYHRRYTLGMLKQRRHRRAIITVGWTGDKRKQYWYPLSQLEDLFFQPENTAGYRTETRPLQIVPEADIAVT